MLASIVVSITYLYYTLAWYGTQGHLECQGLCQVNVLFPDKPLEICLAHNSLCLDYGSQVTLGNKYIKKNHTILDLSFTLILFDQN